MKSLFVMLLHYVLFAVAGAQVPHLINYQGYLTEQGSGTPVADGSYQLSFAIYDTEDGASPIWTEAQTLQVQNGLYAVLLGSQTALLPAIFDGTEKWLGVAKAPPVITPFSGLHKNSRSQIRFI